MTVDYMWRENMLVRLDSARKGYRLDWDDQEMELSIKG